MRGQGDDPCEGGARMTPAFRVDRLSDEALRAYELDENRRREDLNDYDASRAKLAQLEQTFFTGALFQALMARDILTEEDIVAALDRLQRREAARQTMLADLMRDLMDDWRREQRTRALARRGDMEYAR
jgi:hypothetical protein